MARMCEKCQSQRLDQQDDKTAVAGYAGMIPIYKKKYTCKDCRHSWTE